jgi:hypothetical protein
MKTHVIGDVRLMVSKKRGRRIPERILRPAVPPRTIASVANDAIAGKKNLSIKEMALPIAAPFAVRDTWILRR